jgi:hypothetical protein
MNTEDIVFYKTNFLNKEVNRREAFPYRMASLNEDNHKLT